MKTNYIDPSHIWDIRDDNLDATSKALLVRLAGLQHLSEIWVSNKTLASDLGVSKRTIVEKMKVLAKAGYISERQEVNEATQTKVTELKKNFIVEKILESVKGQRKTTLSQHYGVCRETNKKRPLPKVKSEVTHFKTATENQLAEMENEILNFL